MRIAINGMHCEACVRRVRKALDNVGDVKVEAVDVGSATIDALESARPAVIEAIRKAGYEPRDS